MKDKIPACFYKSGNHPTVGTVGELKKQLARLPDDLRIQTGFSERAQLVVYNVDTSPQLEITDVDED